MHLSIVTQPEENPRDRGPLWLAERRAFPPDMAEGLKPRLRLFLSVDLVGSTAMKQSHQQWRPAIINFYRDFDHAVTSRFAALNRDRALPAPAPEVWKTNGDELLYTVELTNLEQARLTILEWLAVLDGYRARIARSGQLDIKSTAWLGLFPIPNAEVFFRRGESRSYGGGPDDAVLQQSELRDQWYAGENRHEITRDFVGPSIDTGFRLTAWARPERFIISVDLAFLLTGASRAGHDPLPLHFSGRESLKGVIDDEPYPTIWLPVGGRGRRPDASLGRDVADPRALRAFCEVIIEQHYRIITPLFLGDDDYQDFDWAPPYIINQVRNLWRDEVLHRRAAMELRA